jgi:hypothetical protein
LKTKIGDLSCNDIKAIPSAKLLTLRQSYFVDNFIHLLLYWVIENDKQGNYVRKFMWQLCGYDRVDISLTVPSSAVLKWYKKKSNAQMSYKCHVYPPRKVAT